MSSQKWQCSMKKNNFLVPLLLFFLQCHLHLLLCDASTTSVHIVYLGEKKHDDPAVTKKSHYKLLSEFLGSTKAARDSIIYSYKHGFSGFAAKLTDTQAKSIEKHPEVVKVVKDHFVKPHTTRSWDFLGINHAKPTNVLTQNMGRGTIIGIIDTGIWPESESFKEQGMPDIPARWKGICQSGAEFNSSNCNRKIIGARWYIKGLEQLLNINITSSNLNDYLSPRDLNSHGTHTASTAAGSFMRNASVDGLAPGLARGGAPLAHLAIYKTMWGRVGMGSGSDNLKAFDQAIHDGVDVISASIGKQVPLYRYNNVHDSVAVGSFHAAAKGITVVASAGNEGPEAQTVENTAPWIISVAATTVDRAFPAAIALGNNRTVWGQTVSFGRASHISANLTYSENGTAFSCTQANLDPESTNGKILVCYHSVSSPNVATASAAVKLAGGVGVIFAQPRTDLPYSGCNVPCVVVDYTTAAQIISYIDHSSSPITKMSHPRTSIGKVPSPQVAIFSSRGPSSLSPEVLKPDIAAPGVDILAAKSNGVYGFESGTSMACPHVSGIVALIKSIHKDWTPSVIRSALVTTASQVARDGSEIYASGPNRKPADPFDIGGGQVDPSKVLDPGLVYNVTTQDYVDYLCATGYDGPSLSVLTNQRGNCNRKGFSALDLNLPSISVPNLKRGVEVTVTRTVTNVGDVNSTYEAILESPLGINITVEPRVLTFDSVTKSLSFKVSFFSKQDIQGHYKFGSLTWTDSKHRVRSPIVVRMTILDLYSDV